MPENEKCFCHLNGLAVKDATARAQIEALRKQMVEELNQRIEALNQQIAALNGSLELLNDLNADMGVAMGDIAAINASLGKMTTDVANNAKAATAAQNTANSAIAVTNTQNTRINAIDKRITPQDQGGYVDFADVSSGCWWNPPMRVGTQYRTTMRWNEKCVYTKLVNCGKMPNKAEKWVDHNADATAVLWAVGQCGNTCFPRVGGSSFIAASIYLNTTSIGIYYGGSDRTDEDALVQIWYVRD